MNTTTTQEELASANTESVTTDEDYSFFSTLAAGGPYQLEDRPLDDLSACAFDVPSDPMLADFSNINWKDFFVMEESMASWQPSTSDPDSRRCFQFLSRFTSKTGLVASFDCGTLHQRQQVVARLVVDQLVPVNSRSTTVADPTSEAALGGGSRSLDPLQWKTHQIILLVKEVITVKPRNSAVTLTWSSVLEQMCLQFFSPPNLRKLLELYWTVWHPNVNFLHRPTFDPVTCKPILLASMALIGKSPLQRVGPGCFSHQSRSMCLA